MQSSSFPFPCHPFEVTSCVLVFVPIVPLVLMSPPAPALHVATRLATRLGTPRATAPSLMMYLQLGRALVSIPLTLLSKCVLKFVTYTMQFPDVILWLFDLIVTEGTINQLF